VVGAFGDGSHRFDDGFGVVDECRVRRWAAYRSSRVAMSVSAMALRASMVSTRLSTAGSRPASSAAAIASARSFGSNVRPAWPGARSVERGGEAGGKLDAELPEVLPDLLNRCLCGVVHHDGCPVLTLHTQFDRARRAVGRMA
jgi:hypothetical protein